MAHSVYNTSPGPNSNVQLHLGTYALDSLSRIPPPLFVFPIATCRAGAPEVCFSSNILPAITLARSSSSCFSYGLDLLPFGCFLLWSGSFDSCVEWSKGSTLSFHSPILFPGLDWFFFCFCPRMAIGKVITWPVRFRCYIHLCFDRRGHSLSHHLGLA